MDLTSIGKNICTYRLKRKWRQEDLAEHAGLSPNYVGALERGEKRPSLSAFIKIVNALEISADLLLADVETIGYTVKESLLAEKLEAVSPQDREAIYAVVEVMLQYAKPMKK